MIRKAVIPVGGLGTRFLPITKSIPKEMLPIVDKPTIEYIVEEAVASGITDILLITNPNKKIIEDHFSRYDKANIYYTHQGEPKGLGHAILCAKSFVGDEPFAVLLGDDIVVSEKPCLKQIINVFEQYDTCSIVGVKEVPMYMVNRYGVINPFPLHFDDRLFHVKSIVEKPCVNEAPSNLVAMGRYVLHSSIFDDLESIPVGINGEIQLTDALQYEPMLACKFEGRHYDIGNKLGFIEANIDFALETGMREELLKLMENKFSKTLD